MCISSFAGGVGIVCDHYAATLPCDPIQIRDSVLYVKTLAVWPSGLPDCAASVVDAGHVLGTFIGPYHPENLTANRLFALTTEQSREQGYSGGAVFSAENNAVVAIQIEGTTVDPAGAHGKTVLAMPLYRVAEFLPLSAFGKIRESTWQHPYIYDVFLSYDRGGAEEKWIEEFFIEELRTWLRVELGLGEDPAVFFDRNAKRGTRMSRKLSDVPVA